MSFFHGKVELKDIGHCFVSLPSKWNVNNFVPNQFNLIILKIIFLDDVKCDKYIYVTWNGTRNYQNDLVIFDRQFASKLGIVADESILVQSDSDSNKFPQCTSLDIRPLTFDDYQLISVNSGEIESELLNQLRVFTTAFCNQNEENKFNIIPIWLRSSGNVPIFVEICNFEPKSQKAIILVDSTKLVIHSPDEKIEFSNLSNNSNEDSTEEVNSSALKSMFGLFRSILPSKPQITSKHNCSDPVSTSQSNKMPISSSNKSIPIYQGQSFLVRVLPHDVNNADSTLPYCSAFISDVHFESFPEKYCLMKLRQIFTVNEKLEQTKKNAELGKNSSVPIDVSKLNTSEDKFNAQFVDKLLRNFEDITECFVLVIANSKCPPDSIQLNESFRVQKGITATSFVQLAQIDSNETSQKISHFDQIAYLSIPVAPQVSLYPINSNTVQLDSWTEEVKAQFKHLFASHSSCLNFANLFFLNSGFIVKLGNFYFVAYFNETLGIDLDRCDWGKLLRNCFLLSPDTEIVLKIVPIKYDTTKLLHKLSKSIRDLDLAHLNLLYACDSSLNKPFGGFKEQFDKCAHFVRMALQLEEDEEKGKPNFALNVSILNLFSSLLICGGKGTGKSTFVNRLNCHFAKNNYVYCQTIQCSFVKGKRIESLQKSWLNSIQEAIQRQPSMLVFEDLDEIAFNADGEAKESEANSNENVSLESVYCERVAYVFSRLVDIVRKLKTSSTFSRVIIIATAKSVTNLNKIIAKSNIFNQVIELTLPDAKQRADIIEQIVHSKDLSLPDRSLRAVINFNTHQLSRETKNYKPEDLNQLLDIAVHNALVDVLRLECHNEPLPEQLSINEQNVHHALTEFTPTHLTGVNLQIHSTRSLEDVGGLHQVKEIVLNTILLPVKYPKIYAHLPLKSQNSILLYGMPGTGKTMLVEAIAHESGLNFIGVKGPELLSKYIGASEQTVRDLFGRAQAAAPSILFFDEFDSLAPRRGHDSTGVTDRIVNQMLTLLDGLEEMRQDVYILAATSRPDLIDLALLRPGRFDRCVQCHLPNEQERTEILISLARKLNIDPQTVHLEDFANETEYFTGADLQALLYNAYLGACKRGCASSDSLQTVVISAEDMQQALGQTAASLSLKERTKFTLLYDRFVRELSGQFVATPQQKATLA